jgi:hypothetical protein
VLTQIANKDEAGETLPFSAEEDRDSDPPADNVTRRGTCTSILSFESLCIRFINTKFEAQSLTDNSHNHGLMSMSDDACRSICALLTCFPLSLLAL